MPCTVSQGRDGRWKVVDDAPVATGGEPKVVGIWNQHPAAVKDMHQRNGTQPPMLGESAEGEE